MEVQSNTIAAFRFINCLKGIGKTTGLIENIKSFIDETLLFKNDFEVMVIVENREMKLLLKNLLTDYYMKYTEIKTMHEIMYKLSEFPINTDNPYDVPPIKYFNFDKTYEKYFVDAGCYKEIAIQQLNKIKRIGEEL